MANTRFPTIRSWISISWNGAVIATRLWARPWRKKNSRSNCYSSATGDTWPRSVRHRGFRSLQEALKYPQPDRVAQFSKRLRLNLPNAFAGQLKFLADFLERMHAAIIHAETQSEHAPFLFIQTGKDIIQVMFEEVLFRIVEGFLRLSVFDEIAQHGIALAPNAAMQRNRLFGKTQD